MNSTTTTRYKAFISYSHSDERWARWLQRRLEGYRPPRSLGHAAALKPVFRDREELAASRDLSAAILSALAESENLIVICSKAAARSHWVDAEIREFIRLGRGDRVFALLVDGQPNHPDEECLPEVLRSTEGHEPLAADVRPQADGRSDALLKIAAALLNVRYDDLRQRANQRRLRRLAVVTAASTAGMLLTLTLATYAFLARQEADSQRRVAVEESEISKEVTEFLVSLFESADPHLAKGEVLTARELLDRGTQRIDGAFADQPKLRARLLSTLGRSYEALGEYDSAASVYTDALTLRRGAGASQALSMTHAMIDLGWVHLWRGDFDTAEGMFREALAIREARLTPPDIDIVHARNNVGIVLYRQDHQLEALEVLEEAHAMLEALAEPDPLDRFAILTNKANSLTALGRPAAAEPLYREILAFYLEHEGTMSVQTAFAHDNLALALQALGQLDEAEPHFLEALRVLEIIFEPDHPELGQTYFNVGGIHLELGRIEEAERLARRSIRIHREQVGEKYFMTADSLGLLTEALIASDRLGPADDAAREALSIAQKIYADDHERMVWFAALRGAVQAAQGLYVEAEKDLLAARDFYRTRGTRVERRKVEKYLAALYAAQAPPESGNP